MKKLKSTKPSHVRTALRALPSTLDETYERILTGINKIYRDDALVLLRWLAYARSPPTLGELVEATIIDLSGEGFVNIDDRGGLEDTLDILSGLVTVEGVDDDDSEGFDIKDDDSDKDEHQYLIAAYSGSRHCIDEYTMGRLAHFSVKEYLESKRIVQSSAQDFHLVSANEHRFLAQSCLTYIMHYSRSGEKLSTERDLVKFPLLLYSAQSWYYHSYLQRTGEVTREMSLLCSENATRDWVLVHRPDSLWERPFTELYEDFDLQLDGNCGNCGIGSGLYYADFLGLEEVVGEFLKAGSNVNGPGGCYGGPLQAASHEGHEKVVQVLIDAGADIDLRKTGYSTALQIASEKGHEKVVQILVDAGADLEAYGAGHGTALQMASRGGHEKVVQTLIDAGANIQARRGLLWHCPICRIITWP